MNRELYMSSSKMSTMLNIFSILCLKKNINDLNIEYKTFLEESTKRLRNYLHPDSTLDNDISFQTIEPIEYINLINDYIVNRKLDKKVSEYIYEFVTNIEKNNINDIMPVLSFYDEKNKLKLFFKD